MEKTAFKLNERTASALCYVFGPLSGLIMYIAEMWRGTKNTAVIFNAFQCVIFFGGFAVLQFILNIFSFTGIINSIIDLFLLVMWAYLIYKSFKHIVYKLPIIGDVCWEKANEM